MQHGVHVLGRRRHVLDDLAVERDEADAVALVVHQVGQARGEDARVVELRDAAAAVVHRLRHVEQHREVHVRLGFVLLDVVAVGARPQPPVHAADVVARHVAAVLGEIDRRAEVRRLVQAVDEAVAHRARDELQVPDACEHHGIHEARAGNGGWCMRRPGGSCLHPAARQRHRLEQPVDEDVGRDPFRLRVEVRDDAVPQHRDARARGCRRSSRDSGRSSAPAPCRRARDTAPRARWRRTPPTSSRCPDTCRPSAGSRARCRARDASPARPPAPCARGAGTRSDPRRVIGRSSVGS